MACFSGAVLSSLSVPALAQTAAQNRAVEVSPASRQLRIALLMPSDDSPFLAAARIVANGFTAANRNSVRPAEVLLVECSAQTNVDAAIDAAVMSGADVVVGPIERDAVEALAAKSSLPIPVLALNTVDVTGSCPENLAMMSIGTEREAEWIAKLAVEALPASTAAGGLPRTAIVCGSAAWETRIRDAYARVLTAAGLSFDVIAFDPETLDDLQTQFEPKLSGSDSAKLNAELRQRLAKAGSDRERKAITRSVHSARRTLIANEEPPYHAALFALSPQEAALVRNRLPFGTRVWATSATSPGDPATSSTSTTLAYDLEGLVFSESPAVVRLDAATFESRFGSAMPYSLSAKRLFALGADAREIAAQWSQRRTIIQFFGETGQLEFNRLNGPVVERTPLAVMIREGRLFEADREAAVKNLEPSETAEAHSGDDGETPREIETVDLPEVKETVGDTRRVGVRSIIIDDRGPGPAPTPMLRTKPAEAAKTPTL